MCEQIGLQSPEDASHPHLHAVWARDRLDLSPAQYEAKVATIKDLEKVWSSLNVSTEGKESLCWSQENTILVDDSSDKAKLQPFNHLKLPSYDHAAAMLQQADDKSGDTGLLQAVAALEAVRRESNISNKIRNGVFAGVGENDAAEWTLRGTNRLEELGYTVQKGFDPDWARKA